MEENEYQKFAKKVQEALVSRTEWIEKYDEYADLLLKNESTIQARRKRFHRSPGLYPYLTIGSVKKNSKETEFNLRFLGQSVADIIVEDNEISLKIGKGNAKNNSKYFGIPPKLVATEEPYSWSGEEAKKFRRYFKNLLCDNGIYPRQQEHMVESALFSELEKSNGSTKALRGIQPVQYAGTRIHMKTAVAASSAKDDNVTIPKSGGGEIDIFCKRKVGNQSYLTIIEVKDENKKSESPEKAIKQAIAYAVFIRELIRSKSGEKWLKIWDIDPKHWQGSGTLNAVVAMPQNPDDDLSFAKKENEGIQIGNDIIKLHYIAFLGDKKPRDGAPVEFVDTSL